MRLLLLSFVFKRGPREEGGMKAPCAGVLQAFTSPESGESSLCSIRDIHGVAQTLAENQRCRYRSGRAPGTDQAAPQAHLHRGDPLSGSSSALRTWARSCSH